MLPQMWMLRHHIVNHRRNALRLLARSLEDDANWKQTQLPIAGGAVRGPAGTPWLARWRAGTALGEGRPSAASTCGPYGTWLTVTVELPTPTEGGVVPWQLRAPRRRQQCRPAGGPGASPEGGAPHPFSKACVSFNLTLTTTPSARRDATLRSLAFCKHRCCQIRSLQNRFHASITNFRSLQTHQDGQSSMSTDAPETLNQLPGNPAVEGTMRRHSQHIFRRTSQADVVRYRPTLSPRSRFLSSRRPSPSSYVPLSISISGSSWRKLADLFNRTRTVMVSGSPVAEFPKSPQPAQRGSRFARSTFRTTTITMISAWLISFYTMDESLKR